MKLGQIDREALEELLENQCEKEDLKRILFLDGYDDAIIGTMTTGGDLVPHIVYDYDLMFEVAYRRCKKDPLYKDDDEDQLVGEAGMLVDDAERAIGYYCTGGRKAPLILNRYVGMIEKVNIVKTKKRKAKGKRK